MKTTERIMTTLREAGLNPIACELAPAATLISETDRLL